MLSAEGDPSNVEAEEGSTVDLAAHAAMIGKSIQSAMDFRRRTETELREPDPNQRLENMSHRYVYLTTIIDIAKNELGVVESERYSVLTEMEYLVHDATTVTGKLHTTCENNHGNDSEYPEPGQQEFDVTNMSIFSPRLVYSPYSSDPENSGLLVMIPRPDSDYCKHPLASHLEDISFGFGERTTMPRENSQIHGD